MMKNILLSNFLMLMVFSACAATSLPVSSSKANVYKIEKTLTNNTKVIAVIETFVFADSSFPYTKPIWWGAEFTTPKTMIKKIAVSFKGAKSWVRFSAYSDLVNIKNVKLIILKNGFQIAINGGESSTHYMANLYFDNDGFLVSRKVYSLLFSDEVWEETKYSFIRRADM